MMRCNRRQLLAATGLLAGSLFLPSTRARAGALAPPKRLVIFFTQHGTVYDNWKMRPGNVGDAQDFQTALGPLPANEFSAILQPLHAMREKLIILDGLAMATVEADVLANAHDLGTRAALSCKKLVNGAAGGPTIDQIVAGHIRVAGRVDSLELAVMGTRNGGAIWRGPGQAIAPDGDPSSVYNRLFPPSFTGSAPSNAERVAARQASVLDVVRAEYQAFASRLGTADRQKLELHRDLVRDIETRLTGLQTMQCTRPGQPQVSNANDASAYQSRAEAMFALTAAALACDLTRVVTIQMDQLGNEQIGAPPGDVHADFAHQQESNPTARQMMTNYGNVHAAQFASLLAQLDAIPEGNGTVLDSCAVVWVSELANGVHSYRPWPVVIGGRLLSPGRYVYLNKDTPNPSPYTNFPGWIPTIGPPHNKMWTSVARAVGADISSVGETELVCANGAQVDCTGPLADLA